MYWESYDREDVYVTKSQVRTLFAMEYRLQGLDKIEMAAECQKMKGILHLLLLLCFS